MGRQHPAMIVGLGCAAILLSSCGSSGFAPGPGAGSTRTSPGSSAPRAPGPTVKWHADVGGAINTPPVVAGGVVYVAADRYVYALDPTAGQVKWQSNGLGHRVTGPAVGEGLLYVGAADRPGLADRRSTTTAYALNTQTGAIRWQQELTTDRSADLAPPVVAAGLVYFGSGWSDFSCCEFRGNGGHLLALDGQTGRLVWQRATQGEDNAGFAVGNGLLYFGAGANAPDPPAPQLRALDAQTGQDVWTVPAAVAVPVLAPDGAPYAVGERDRHRLNAQTGPQLRRWSPDPAQESLARPALADDTVYVIGNAQRDLCWEGPCPPPRSHTDTVYALDATTGHARWQQDIAGGNSGTRDGLLFQHYLCYASSESPGDKPAWDTRVSAVERTNGAVAWQVEAAGQSLVPAPVGGNRLYLATHKDVYPATGAETIGTVYALQLP